MKVASIIVSFVFMFTFMGITSKANADSLTDLLTTVTSRAHVEYSVPAVIVTLDVDILIDTNSMDPFPGP